MRAMPKSGAKATLGWAGEEDFMPKFPTCRLDNGEFKIPQEFYKLTKLQKEWDDSKKYHLSKISLAVWKLWSFQMNLKEYRNNFWL